MATKVKGSAIHWTFIFKDVLMDVLMGIPKRNLLGHHYQLSPYLGLQVEAPEPLFSKESGG